MGEVHSKVARWLDQITSFQLQFHHRANTDKLIKIANGLSRVCPSLQGELNQTDRRKMDFEIPSSFRNHLRFQQLASTVSPANAVHLAMPLGLAVDIDIETTELEQLLGDDIIE